MSETKGTDFRNHFPTARAAIEFEQTVLSAGREFLPPSARQVLDGGEPTPAYWDFLIDQLESAERSA